MESNGQTSDEFQDLTQDLKLKSGEFAVSLWLQMCIYFNSYFAGVWIIAQLLSLTQKLHILSDIHRFLAITSLSILVVIEIPRLYLGYVGNLFDRIRQLLAFVLLSVLIQFPIHLFRQIATIFGVFVTPFEIVIDIIMFIFLVLEIVLSINTLGQQTRRQVMQSNLKSQ